MEKSQERAGQCVDGIMSRWWQVLDGKRRAHLAELGRCEVRDPGHGDEVLLVTVEHQLVRDAVGVAVAHELHSLERAVTSKLREEHHVFTERGTTYSQRGVPRIHREER